MHAHAGEIGHDHGKIGRQPWYGAAVEGIGPQIRGGECARWRRLGEGKKAEDYDEDDEVIRVRVRIRL